jgi:ligand-binding sensor domain-containing protein
MRRRTRIATFVAAALLFALTPPVFAADLRSVLTQYTVASWSEKDGLPEGSIYVLAQDADGYLWVGTQAGPYRFDGVRFTPWATLVNDAQPRAARALHAASDGSMWIGFGGQGGIAVYKGGLRRMYGTADGLPAASVSTLIEHPAGTTWAGTSLGLFRLQQDRWERIGASRGVPEGPVSIGTVNRDGQLLVGSSRHLLQFDPATEQFSSIAAFTEDVRALVQEPHGRMAVTDQVGGYRRLGDAAYAGVPMERGRGRALLRDSRGNLWVGTAGQGLWRVRSDERGEVQSVEHATALTGLLADGVLALAEDREGNIWAGTTEGINRLTPYKVTQVTGIGLVAGVEQASGGELWVGTVDELLRVSGPEAPTSAAPRVLRGARLRALHTDRSGQLWVATD